MMPPAPEAPTETPPRPADVPPNARLVDIETLAEIEKARPDRRTLLRVAFPFVLWTVRGRLRHVMPGALSVEGRVYVLNGPDGVPLIWVWTLADERAAA